MAGLNALDLLILATLGAGAWRGMRTGAVRQAVGVVGAVVAFWVAAVLMEPAGVAVVESLGLSERVSPVVGFVVVFCGVLAVLAAASHIARKTLESLKMGFMDRGLGGLFGGIRAGVGISVFLLATSSVPGSGGGLIGEGTRSASALYEPTRALAPALWEGFRALAPGWQGRLQDKFEALSGV
jgi:membrane protein required for colicin V production